MRGHEKVQCSTGKWRCDFCQSERKKTPEFRAYRREYMRERRRRVPVSEARKRSQREWRDRQYAENPEYRDKVKARVALRRAIENAPSVLIVHELVFERDGWICQLCADPVDPYERRRRWRASLDHIVPLSKGGSHTYDNVQLAHAGCNSRKGNRA